MAIYDQDISTAFAIEAFALVDHFKFRDKFGSNNNPVTIPGKGGVDATNPKTATIDPGKPSSDPGICPMTIEQNDLWTKNYYDESDTHCKERVLLS